MGRLDKMLLWGHDLADYKQMFDLTDEDCRKSILDFGAGPASFAAELNASGGNVVACDEIYSLTRAEIEAKFSKEFTQMLAAVEQRSDCFVWETIQSPQVLNDMRHKSFDLFLDDYEKGVKEKRYLTEDLPAFSFGDNQFQLAVSSHALFITHNNQQPDFHVAAIAEFCRVAHEVRIFPLLNENGDISPLVGPVLLGLQQMNYNTEVREVDYEFQKGGNAMLRVWKDACPL